MPTQQDLQIFVTGVVGRAMGSGKFSAKDISDLVSAAKLAFTTYMGPIETAPAPRPQAPPPARMGAAQHIGAVVQQTLSGEGGIPPANEGSFGKWGSFTAHFYGFGKDSFCEAYGKAWAELTWGDFLELAQRGDREALKALDKMAGSTPKPGKYEKNDRFRIANAKCVLLMAKKQAAAPPMVEEEPEWPADDQQTPF